MARITIKRTSRVTTEKITTVLIMDNDLVIYRKQIYNNAIEALSESLSEDEKWILLLKSGDIVDIETHKTNPLLITSLKQIE